MKKRGKKDKKKIPLRIGDKFNTIIYIDEDENPEEAIKKFNKDLEEYKKAAITNFTKGRLLYE